MKFTTVKIDDEVLAALGREAIPFVETTPNEVLRRLLLTKKTAPAGKPGHLLPMVEAGALKPGDRLVHEQPRKRRRHFAEVTADGCVKLDDGRSFEAPSPALKACVGSDINGWAHWTVERLGETLDELRSRQP